MADRWGDDGPPAEAYSRVSRDPVEVTAEFARWAAGLGERLTDAYDASVRAATGEEAERLRRLNLQAESVVVVPADPAASPLIVGISSTPEYGTGVALGFGRAAVEGMPTCLCDACDEDSDDMIAVLEDTLAAVVGGFEEFRRPADPIVDVPGAMEEGYEWADGGSSGAPRSGEPFEQTWAPWPRRSR